MLSKFCFRLNKLLCVCNGFHVKHAEDGHSKPTIQSSTKRDSKFEYIEEVFAVITSKMAESPTLDIDWEDSICMDFV